MLHDISLRIASDEHLAILGPNGCGKSTLIKTMNCECYPLAREGMRAHIFGRERWEVIELRKRLGVVAAELPRERTLHTKGRDAVLSGFFASSTIWPESTSARRCASAPTLCSNGWRPAAGGKAGRRNVRRGDAPHPDRPRAGAQAGVLLIDEPSNALDLAAQSELRQTLRRLARHGIGILLVTHHLADIPPEIERVVMMQEGQIVADGPKAKVLTKARLQKLFGVAVTMARRDGFYHVW